MAGTLIVSNLTTDTDNTFIVRSNTGTTLFSANTTGIDVANSIGATAITNDKILSVANTKISGNIISSQIAPSVTLTTPIISGNLNLDSAGTTGIRAPSANTITFHTAGTEDMRIDSVGNVMIGTTTSQTGAKLSVTGGIQGIITSGTAVASTSGTSIDFIGIPSWVKRITVMFNAVSTTGSSDLTVQLGTSGGVTTSGYRGAAQRGTGAISDTNGFNVTATIASSTLMNGSITITSLDSANNIWAQSGVLGHSDGAAVAQSGGSVTLASALTRVRLTTVGGTDTFDAGSVNILYEG